MRFALSVAIALLAASAALTQEPPVIAPTDAKTPAEEQKARIYLFTSDESQSAMAKELAAVLESAGFDVAGISKNSTRRVEDSEIRYFREPEDKADATRIQDLFIKQTGQSDAKIIRTSDAENASGSRKFQIWIGKPAPVIR